MSEPARRTWLMVLAWLWVGLPFAYGVYELVRKVTQLFGG
ncbi:MFS transporter small subunit [Amycolatopsis anabasis]